LKESANFKENIEVSINAMESQKDAGLFNYKWFKGKPSKLGAEVEVDWEGDANEIVTKFNLMPLSVFID